MWTRAETGLANEAFRLILEQCEDYAPFVDELMPKLARPNRVMWVWQSAQFRLALCYQLSSDHTYARIVVGVPSPEGNQQQWVRTIITKIRQEMDALGIEDWGAGQKEEYQSEHMAEFADGIDRVVHELKGDSVRNGKRRLVFKRRASQKYLDDRFEGPGKNRAPRQRRPQR